jgi:3-phosphoshikimate 1-carboxyvinyltransferase
VTRVAEARGPLRGEVEVPGDKSIGHRAVIFASVAEGRSRISNFSGGDDNRRTLEAFRRMGVEVREEGDRLEIEGKGWEGLRAAAGVLDCGNSGTTMRLLSGVLAGRPFTSILDGDASLRRRPMERIIEPLRRMGGAIESLGGDGRAPLRIEGKPLRGIRYPSPIASAQVKSAVLLAGLQAAGETVVEEPQRSRDHTEIMARAFGARLEVNGCTVALRGPQALAARDVSVPGDLSSAAFFLVAAATVPGSSLLIRSVGCNPTRAGVLEVLRRMGARLSLERPREIGGEPVADLRVEAARLSGVEIGPEMVASTIDEYPVLCVAAALAEGATTIRGAAELRWKESDRIATMAAALRRLGVEVEEWQDGMRIEGRAPLRGGAVRTHGDHRVAMALAVAGLSARGGVELDDSRCADISFPGFFELLDSVRSDGAVTERPRERARSR